MSGSTQTIIGDVSTIEMHQSETAARSSRHSFYTKCKLGTVLPAIYYQMETALLDIVSRYLACVRRSLNHDIIRTIFRLLRIRYRVQANSISVTLGGRGYYRWAEPWAHLIVPWHPISKLYVTTDYRMTSYRRSYHVPAIDNFDQQRLFPVDSEDTFSDACVGVCSCKVPYHYVRGLLQRRLDVFIHIPDNYVHRCGLRRIDCGRVFVNQLMGADSYWHYETSLDRHALETPRLSLTALGNRMVLDETMREIRFHGTVCNRGVRFLTSMGVKSLPIFQTTDFGLGRVFMSDCHLLLTTPELDLRHLMTPQTLGDRGYLRDLLYQELDGHESLPLSEWHVINISPERYLPGPQFARRHRKKFSYACRGYHISAEIQVRDGDLTMSLFVCVTPDEVIFALPRFRHDPDWDDDDYY